VRCRNLLPEDITEWCECSHRSLFGGDPRTTTRNLREARTRFVKRYPPDPIAIIFWLKTVSRICGAMQQQADGYLPENLQSELLMTSGRLLRFRARWFMLCLDLAPGHKTKHRWDFL
jgi:hypothetical protein